MRRAATILVLTVTLGLLSGCILPVFHGPTSISTQAMPSLPSATL